MRAILIAISILAGAAGAAPPDLLPREGNGWTGFGKGTWCKLKSSGWATGMTPGVSVSVSTLVEVGKETLKIESTTVDMVGRDKKETLELPAAGEAQKGEKEEKRETLADESVIASGKTLPCARTRVTIAGAAGKRLVTRWEARDPRVLVKKTVETFDAAGKVASTEVMLLTSTDASHEVAGRSLRCLLYTTRTTHSGGIAEGTVYFTRDVPVGIVRQDTKVTKDGVVVYTFAAELLDFEIK